MTDKQIEILENYVKSKGKGLFEDVKITIGEYSEVTVGIYIDWDYFPENHGVYKLKDSYLTKLRESIKTFFKMSDINEHKFWFIDIVIMNNFDESSPEEPLNEIAVNGKCFVYCKPDGYFKVRGYMSDIMENPTYGDLLKVANDLINSTEDFDHHFLEGFDVNVINEEGLQQVKLSFGS